MTSGNIDLELNIDSACYINKNGQYTYEIIYVKLSMKKIAVSITIKIYR